MRTTGDSESTWDMEIVMMMDDKQCVAFAKKGVKSCLNNLVFHSKILPELKSAVINT